MDIILNGYRYIKAGNKYADGVPNHIERLFVIGSSGVGKISLVNYIRDNAACYRHGLLQVPLRYITRPARKNDDVVENCHVNHEAFQTHVQDGTIDFHWQRDLGADTYERYGFAAARKNIMPLYSCNMALVKDGNGLAPADTLENGLIIGVYAANEMRVDRFSKRSPDVLANRKEAEKRLSDDPAIVFEKSHIVLDNSYPLEDVGREFVTFLEKLFEGRPGKIA